MENDTEKYMQDSPGPLSASPPPRFFTRPNRTSDKIKRSFYAVGNGAWAKAADEHERRGKIDNFTLCKNHGMPFGFLLVPATRRPCDLSPAYRRRSTTHLAYPYDPDLRRPMFPNLHPDCDSAAAYPTEKNRVDDIDTVKLSCSAMKEKQGKEHGKQEREWDVRT